MVCWGTSNIKNHNNARPRVAAVCREVAQVAREHRYIFDGDARFLGLNLEIAWIQLRRDNLLHTNWIWEVDDPERVDFARFFAFAQHIGVQPSIMADHIYSYSLHQPLSMKPPCVFFPPLKRDECIAQVAACLLNQSLTLVVCSLSIHVPEEAAMASGLFGLLGDAPVQMVDYDNERLLRDLEYLVRTHACDSDVVAACERLIAPSFADSVRVWQKSAEWRVLAHMWLRDKVDMEKRECSGYLPEHYRAWKPPLQPDAEVVSMENHEPNEAHPWMIQAKKTMPRLRPQVMFLHCKKSCRRRYDF